MEGDLVNKRLLFSLSISWLFVRLGTCIITPFFMDGHCDARLPLFLRLVLYTTAISVFAQLVFFSYLIIASRTAKSPQAKMGVFSIQVTFYLIDYLVYGICRFVIFIIGAVWLNEADDCDTSIWVYSLVLIVGYFAVFWLMCWCIILTVFMTWWDSYTL